MNFFRWLGISQDERSENQSNLNTVSSPAITNELSTESSAAIPECPNRPIRTAATAHNGFVDNDEQEGFPGADFTFTPVLQAAQGLHTDLAARQSESQSHLVLAAPGSPASQSGSEESADGNPVTGSISSGQDSSRAAAAVPPVNTAPQNTSLADLVQSQPHKFVVNNGCHTTFFVQVVKNLIYKMQAQHSLGQAHAELKPDCIMLTCRGQVELQGNTVWIGQDRSEQQKEMQDLGKVIFFCLTGQQLRSWGGLPSLPANKPIEQHLLTQLQMETQQATGGPTLQQVLQHPVLQLWADDRRLRFLAAVSSCLAQESIRLEQTRTEMSEQLQQRCVEVMGDQDWQDSMAIEQGLMDYMTQQRTSFDLHQWPDLLRFTHILYKHFANIPPALRPENRSALFRYLRFAESFPGLLLVVHEFVQSSCSDRQQADIYNYVNGVPLKPMPHPGPQRRAALEPQNHPGMAGPLSEPHHRAALEPQNRPNRAGPLPEPHHRAALEPQNRPGGAGPFPEPQNRTGRTGHQHQPQGPSAPGPQGRTGSTLPPSHANRADVDGILRPRLPALHEQPNSRPAGLTGLAGPIFLADADQDAPASEDRVVRQLQEAQAQLRAAQQRLAQLQTTQQHPAEPRFQGLSAQQSAALSGIPHTNHTCFLCKQMGHRQVHCPWNRTSRYFNRNAGPLPNQAAPLPTRRTE